MKNEESARRLRKALADSGLTQQELSDKSGVSKSSISQYINGTHVPSNKKAALIANVLECNPLWLMGFDISEKKEQNLSRFTDMIESLSPEERNDVMDYIKFVISKRK